MAIELHLQAFDPVDDTWRPCHDARLAHTITVLKRNTPTSHEINFIPSDPEIFKGQEVEVFVEGQSIGTGKASVAQKPAPSKMGNSPWVNLHPSFLLKGAKINVVTVTVST